MNEGGDKKKVLVTGAAGYIGRHLVPTLLRENYTVYALTRQNNPILKGNKQVITIVGDITNPLDLSRDLSSGLDTIYHLAGVIREPEKMEDVNVLGTRNIVDLALKQNCKLIYLSSAGITGKTKEEIIDEQTPCNPQNAYEKSKYKAEQVVLDGIKNGLKTHILRPSTIFGIKEHPERDGFFQLLKTMRSGHYKNVGKGVYNIIHIDEVVNALLTLNKTSAPLGGIYIINNTIIYSDLNKLVKNIPPVVQKKTLSIPYLVACMASIIFSILCFITRQNNPLTLFRLRTLVSQKRYSQEKLQKIGFKNSRTLEGYLASVCQKYIQLGLLP